MRSLYWFLHKFLIPKWKYYPNDSIVECLSLSLWSCIYVNKRKHLVSLDMVLNSSGSPGRLSNAKKDLKHKKYFWKNLKIQELSGAQLKYWHENLMKRTVSDVSIWHDSNSCTRSFSCSINNLVTKALLCVSKSSFWCAHKLFQKRWKIHEIKAFSLHPYSPPVCKQLCLIESQLHIQRSKI